MATQWQINRWPVRQMLRDDVVPRIEGECDHRKCELREIQIWLLQPWQQRKRRWDPRNRERTLQRRSKIDTITPTSSDYNLFSKNGINKFIIYNWSNYIHTNNKIKKWKWKFCNLPAWRSWWLVAANATAHHSCSMTRCGRLDVHIYWRAKCN